ncbi:MAG: hypothetical protein LBR18_04210 [Tannerella sp.]|nr:hypothetical protein [Tannerella sp.]
MAASISKVPAWAEVQVPFATWAVSLESWAASARWTLTPAGEEPVLIDIPLWERIRKVLIFHGRMVPVVNT